MNLFKRNDAGKAITAAMRAERERDFEAACNGAWGYDNINRLRAWLWWGWSLMGLSGKNYLCYPGLDFRVPTGPFKELIETCWATGVLSKQYYSDNRWVNQ